MLLSKKYLTEETPSQITKLEQGESTFSMRNPAGCNPATQSGMSWTCNCFLILHHKKKKYPNKTKQKSSREAVLFPWFILLLFKASSSWEVAGCKVLNSVGVRHDTLSKTSTVNHFNQADIFRSLRAPQGTFSEFQYCTISGKGTCIFAAIPGNLNIFNLKISNAAFISCKGLVKMTEDESRQSIFQDNVGD